MDFSFDWISEVCGWWRCRHLQGRGWWEILKGCSKTRLQASVGLPKTTILCSGMLWYLGKFRTKCVDSLHLCLLMLFILFPYINIFEDGWISCFWFLFWFGLQSWWYAMGWRWVILLLVLLVKECGELLTTFYFPWALKLYSRGTSYCAVRILWNDQWLYVFCNFVYSLALYLNLDDYREWAKKLSSLEILFTSLHSWN